MKGKIISGIGIDIIEVKRVKAAICRNEKILKKIYTEEEIKYCGGKANQLVKYICYAQKFAAKEAVAKALGVGFGLSISFNEIEIKNLSSGKPVVLLYGKANDFCKKNRISLIELTVSGTKNYAVAFAIALKES